MTNTYTLPQLPYSYDALEPHISTQIMTLHHSKHHQTYITNLNTALGTLHKSQHDIPTQIALQSAMKFNGGGHINHSLFWANLAPASSPNTKIESAAPKLAKAISAQWGSHGAFQAEFEKMLLGIQGSGWGWLIKTRAGMGAEGLVMMTTRDQDSVVEEGKVPLLGVDMWEHAYYLQYLNGKAAYVKAIWNVVNWKVVEERFLGPEADVFKALKATM